MSFCLLVLNMFWRRKTQLNFESHIEAKLGTANQMLVLIRRSFICCMALYKAFVCQHLEFGVAVWGDFIKRRQLHAIEKVQMRETEIMESVKDMPYEERLRKLKLPTMTYRSARGLMMEVWKHQFRLQTTQPTSGGAVTANSSCCANCVEPPRPNRNIGLPPLARVMGVGRQQASIPMTHMQSHQPSILPDQLGTPFSSNVSSLRVVSLKSFGTYIMD